MPRRGQSSAADGADTSAILQGSFTSGELAPALYARTDLSKFHSGAKLLRNFFVQAQGGVLNRAGTRFVGFAVGGDVTTRVIPFEFNNEQEYVLVLTPGAIQIVADAGFVTEDGTGSTPPITVTTPYAAGDLFDITYCQSADVLTLCHPSYPPAQLSRSSATAWAYAPIIVGTKLSPPVIQGVAGNNQGYPDANGNVKYLDTPFIYALTSVSVNPPDESMLGTSMSCFNYDLGFYNYGVHNDVRWFATTDPRVDHVNVYRYYNGAWAYVTSTTGITRDGGVQQWSDLDITPDSNRSPPVGTNPFETASFIGSINGANLTVTSMLSGAMHEGQAIGAPGVMPNTKITGVPAQVVFSGSITGTVLTVTAINTPNLIQASLVASIAGTTMTVTELQGYLDIGDVLGGPGLAPGTDVTGLPPQGGPGVYTVSGSQTLASETLTVVYSTGEAPGVLEVGQAIGGPNVTAGTTIVPGGTGTGGTGTYNLSTSSVTYTPSPVFPTLYFTATTTGIGTYTVSPAQTVASCQMTGDPNYPGACCYFQERAVFGGATNNPDQMVTSRAAAAYTNFNVSMPQVDTDAITVTLASNQVNAIRHMVPVNDLVVFTDAGAWKVSGQSNSGDVITPSNVVATIQSYSGASNVPPIVVSPDILYVQEKGAAVRMLAYNVYSNLYTGEDISVLSSHLFIGYQIVDWAFAREPWKIVWATRSDGVLLGLTYLKEQDVEAWHHHDTASTYGGAASTFESVCSIGEGSEDVVYLVVRRFLNGAWQRCIERMQSRVLGAGDSQVTSSWFVDCGLQYAMNTPQTVFTGLTHLVGQTVAILADGAVKDQQVVSPAGSITLTAPASTVTVGLPIQAQMETLPIDAGNPTVQGKYKRVTQARVFVYNTRGLKVGPDTPNGPDLELVRPRGIEPWGAPPALYTGQQLVHVPGTWDAYASLWVQQDDPLPACVLGIEPWVSVGE